MKLSVLHLDHTSAPGGAEFALLRLLEQDPRWEAKLLLPSNDSWGIYGALLGRIPMRRIGPAQTFGASKAGRSVFATAGFAWRVLGQAIAVRKSPEFKSAATIHTNTSRAAVYGAIACWGTKKNLVLHLRDTVNRETLGATGLALLTRIAFSRADGVIANSQSTLATAEPYLRRSTSRVVIASPAGLRPRAAEQDYRSVRKVGMVARIDPWKGQDLLVRAFADVFAGKDARLVFAGGTAFGNENYLEALAQLAADLGISDRVDFLGHVDDVNGLIDDLDICVQASIRPEPLGQNVLQYLAASKPTIATDAGGPAEWITHGRTGLLFETGSWQSLARALREMDGDAALRSTLGRAAGKTPGLASDAELASEHGRFLAEVSGSLDEVSA